MIAHYTRIEKSVFALFFHTYLSRYTECNSHFRHQEQDRRTSVTDKRKCNARIWYCVGHNRYIQNHLDRNMGENATGNQLMWTEL